MIARTDQPLADVGDEVREDLRLALYVPRSIDDVPALQAAGLAAAHPSAPADLHGLLPGRRHVVLVDNLAPDVREHVHDLEPAADVLDVGLPPGMGSITAMLGFDPTRCSSWDEVQAEQATETWLDWCATHARTSMHATASSEAVVEMVQPHRRVAEPWPQPMGKAIRIGVLGDLLDAVEEQTEADPHAIAADFLTRLGNAVGRGPHFTVSGDRHGCNLFVGLVGRTGQGRKGSSAAYPSKVMSMAAPVWASTCVKQGLSSGEGVIHAVRDPGPSGRVDKEGQPIMDPGATDKRLLAYETELGRTLRAAGRRDNVLLPIMRQAWEGGRLAALTKQPYSATDAHVSLLSHVTAEELRGLLHENDVYGGTINRVLLVASRRQRSLPFGGEVSDEVLSLVAQQLGLVIRNGSDLREVRFGATASEMWPAIYTELQADECAQGIVGAMLARATVQVRRLAMLFAIADYSDEVLHDHLKAALAFWRYSRATVRMVFGTTTGNKVADRILGELRGNPETGVDRSKMHDMFDRHVSAEDIDRALAVLHEAKLAFGKRIPTGGRPRIVWFPIEPGA